MFDGLSKCLAIEHFWVNYSFKYIIDNFSNSICGPNTNNCSIKTCVTSHSCLQCFSTDDCCFFISCFVASISRSKGRACMPLSVWAAVAANISISKTYSMLSSTPHKHTQVRIRWEPNARCTTLYDNSDPSPPTLTLLLILLFRIQHMMNDKHKEPLLCPCQASFFSGCEGTLGC